jgi:GAF domain-containing protein
MSFAAGLGQALQLRQTDVVSELDAGESLEDVLIRHLHVVEQMSDSEILTSVLLLSEDGKHLTHGAAPSLPQVYREAIDGLEIGPSAGSCGTAAFTGRPVYVTDIATDPLWAPYRDLALPHGLRSCWSTPIRDGDGPVLGTFAIYNRAVRGPTADELSAIDLITDKVAQAIAWSRRSSDEPHVSELLPRQLAALQAITAAIRTQASTLDAEGREAVDEVVAATDKLARIVERQLA